MVQKATLRRFVFGIVWFMVFAYGISIGGMMWASSALDERANAETHRMAQENFAKTYGRYIFLGSLIVAIGGTVAGVLPGTRK